MLNTDWLRNISSMEYIENLRIMMNRIILKFFKESNRTENCPNFQLIYFQSSSGKISKNDHKTINIEYLPYQV